MLQLKKVDPDYTNFAVGNNVAATLYHFPEGKVNVDFWMRDRKLLMLLEAHMLALRGLKSRDEGRGVGYMYSFIPSLIEEMFNGTQIPEEDDSRSVLAGYPGSLQQISEAIPEIYPGPEKWGWLMTLLNESIDNYTRSHGREYMITFHKPDKLDEIYMTMMIRRLSKNVVEHRFIQQSVKALIEPKLAPIWNREVKPIPRQLSLPLHGVALEMITSLHPEVDTLEIHPLPEMRNILIKRGYIKEDSPAIVRVSGDVFGRLRDEYFNCVHCGAAAISVMCGGECKQAMYCTQKCADGHYKEHKHECSDFILLPCGSSLACPQV